MTTPDFDGLLEVVIASNAAELKVLSERLANLTGQCASDADVNLRERIYSLTNNAVGDSQPQVFDGLCERLYAVWGEGISDRKIVSDAQILANSATPDLVRYLAVALRSFHDRDLKGALPRKRSDALARAMLSAMPVGGHSKVKNREVEIIDAAKAAYRSARGQGQGRDVAERAALDAARLVFRSGENSSVEEDDREVRRTVEKLRKLLHPEGLFRLPDHK